MGIAMDVELCSEYESEYGWTMTLPSGWEKLDDVGSSTLTGFKPVVFSTSTDWSIAITWMRSPRPWTPDVVDNFDKLIATDGPVPLDEADRFVKTVFSTAGTVTEARTVTLKSGERGLEIIEFIPTTTPPRCGYQLILAAPCTSPDVNNISKSQYFERIVFYAETSKFSQRLNSIKEACTSFRRIKPVTNCPVA